MSTVAILAVTACALIGWCVLVQAVGEVLVARAQPQACQCRDLHSLTLTPGSVFELPPGTNLATATEADPRFASFTQKPKEAVSLHLDLARMARRAGEVH